MRYTDKDRFVGCRKGPDIDDVFMNQLEDMTIELTKLTFVDHPITEIKVDPRLFDLLWDGIVGNRRYQGRIEDRDSLILYLRGGAITIKRDTTVKSLDTFR